MRLQRAHTHTAKHTAMHTASADLLRRFLAPSTTQCQGLDPTILLHMLKEVGTTLAHPIAGRAHSCTGGMPPQCCDGMLVWNGQR